YATVTVNVFGLFCYMVNMTVFYRIFNLNNGTLEVPNGVSLTLRGATINGGFPISIGMGQFVTGGNTYSTFNGSTLSLGTSVNVINGNLLLNNVTTGAAITVASGQTLALTRGRQTGCGVITLNGYAFAQYG